LYRRRLRLHCGCLSLVIAVALVVLLGAVFFRPLARLAAMQLVEDDGPHKADAVLVLGGDEYCTRILTAAQLASRGLAPVVLVSGPDIFRAHESDFTIPCATRQGYPATLFKPITSSSDSTRMESRLIGNYLRAHGIRTVLLVTSIYHTRRAARLFRSTNPWLTLHVAPAPDPFFTPQTWWQTRTGQRLFVLEWTKTLAASIGY